ncbi:putative U box domain, armadillo-like helical, Zinc finger, RING/FYVE/PHD-type [Dioscorea sansibarensis]
MSIPWLFRCPISLDLFTDPVTLSTGQTYDRPSIEKWLAGGHLTCPVTMQSLNDTSLVPNHTLRHLIDRWLITGHETTKSKPINFINSLATLKLSIQSAETSIETKLEALKKVRILSVESDNGQASLIQLGFFPFLLDLLFQTPHLTTTTTTTTTYPELFTEVALDCILSLSPEKHSEFLNVLKNESCLASLGVMLDQGNVKIKTCLCTLIETIASCSVTRQVCLAIGQSQKVLQVLVSLLCSSTGFWAMEAAVRAVYGICTLEANRDNLVKEGAIDGLFSYLSSSVRRNASQALASIEALLVVDAGRKSLLMNVNAVGVLVQMVFVVNSDHEASEHAVGALLIMCCESMGVRAEAVNAGVLKQLLLLLQSQCGVKAKTKARALLKLLRSVWAEDPGVCNFYNAM